MMDKKDVPVLPQGGVGHLREMCERFGLVEECYHDWVFLRTESRVNPRWSRHVMTEPEFLKADAFYCRHCLEYRKVGIDGED